MVLGCQKKLPVFHTKTFLEPLLFFLLCLCALVFFPARGVLTSAKDEPRSLSFIASFRFFRDDKATFRGCGGRVCIGEGSSHLFFHA